MADSCLRRPGAVAARVAACKLASPSRRFPYSVPTVGSTHTCRLADYLTASLEPKQLRSRSSKVLRVLV